MQQKSLYFSTRRLLVLKKGSKSQFQFSNHSRLCQNKETLASLEKIHILGFLAQVSMPNMYKHPKIHSKLCQRKSLQHLQKKSSIFQASYFKFTPNKSQYFFYSFFKACMTMFSAKCPSTKSRYTQIKTLTCPEKQLEQNFGTPIILPFSTFSSIPLLSLLSPSWSENHHNSSPLTSGQSGKRCNDFFFIFFSFNGKLRYVQILRNSSLSMK